MVTKRQIRVFISSPGDVAEERKIAQEVIEQQLQKDPALRDQLAWEVIRWDDPAAPAALPATLSPQEAVNRGLGKPSECDVVIVILWCRFGTPLKEPLRPDGTQYLSGTEWEFEDAMTADRRPHVLVYRRTSKPPWDMDDPDLQAKLAQRELVKQFFDHFGSGAVPGIYAQYGTPQELRERLLHDLKTYASNPPPPPPPPEDLPPYSAIAKALLEGSVVPFIGPGACASGRPRGAVWDPNKAAFLPSGIELTHLLAEAGHFPEEDAGTGLSAAASCYATLMDREGLREQLRQILSNLLPKIEIPPLYRRLAAIPRPLLIITTNFDTKLEQAFRAAGRTYDLVVYPAEQKDCANANAVLWWPHGSDEPKKDAPNKLDIDLRTTSVIFKMYGSFSGRDDWDGYVITEDDYVKLCSRLPHMHGETAIPSLFTSHFRESHLLFLGWDLRDWPLRVITGSLSLYMKNAQSTEGEPLKSWAIASELSPLERQLWPRLGGVVPYRVDLDRFVEELGKRVEALRQRLPS